MSLIADIRSELKKLSTTPRQLRRFGLIVGGIFTLLGAVTMLRRADLGPWLLAIGLALVALGWLAPRALLYPYRYWIALSVVLGYFVSRAILTVLFYVVLTPIATIVRLTRGDPLDRRLDRRPSYWIERQGTTGATDAEKLY